MAVHTEQMTSFTYTTYIQATPERVWQGLTEPALTRRYWRHQRAGAKTFRSNWKKGSTYDHHRPSGRSCTDGQHRP
jgi:uncharacterized protein YndB with AHSA1/START domain